MATNRYRHQSSSWDTAAGNGEALGIRCAVEASSTRLLTSTPRSTGLSVACADDVASAPTARSRAARTSSLLRPMTTGGTSMSAGVRALPFSAMGRMETVSSSVSVSSSFTASPKARALLRLMRRKRVSNPRTTSSTSVWSAFSSFRRGFAGGETDDPSCIARASAVKFSLPTPKKYKFNTGEAWPSGEE